MIAKPTAMSSALVCLLLLAGCPGGPPQPTDDDDTTAPDDDDDATDDDDDATDDDDAADDDDATDDDDAADDDDSAEIDFLCPDGETIVPIDLTDGPGFLRTTFALTQLRYLGEILGFGMANATPNCPTWSGDHPSADGTTTFTGGCTTDGGSTFTGELVQTHTSTDGSATKVTTTDSWLATSSGDFTELEFSGAWSATEGDGGVWRNDTSEGSMRLLGVPGSQVESEFPHGVVGAYDWTGDWTAPPYEEHTFTFDGTIRCRGPLVATITFGESGECFGSRPDSGAVVLEAFGNVAEVDFSDDDSCLGCWPWTLNGELQESMVCSFAR